MSLITGRAKKYDGTAIDYVSIFNWADGKCIAQVNPNSSGLWTYYPPKDMDIGVTYVADGCEPITHGSYFFTKWTPIDLFTIGVEGAYYDPSDITTLFQDIAGTVPVTADGQAVALMKDKSGNNNHLIQSNASARPKYKTDSVLHWLDFDGIDDVMVSDYVTWNGANFMTSLAIFEKSKNFAGFSFTDGANRFYEEYSSDPNAADTKTIVQRYPNRVVPFNTAVTRDNPYVTWSVNGNSFKTGLLPVGGSVDVGTTTLTSAQAKITIGHGYADGMGDMRFYGFLWLSKTPSDVERDAVNAYMLSKTKA